MIPNEANASQVVPRGGRRSVASSTIATNSPKPTAMGTSGTAPARERRSMAALAIPVAVSARPTRIGTPRRGSVRRSVAGKFTRGSVRPWVLRSDLHLSQSPAEEGARLSAQITPDMTVASVVGRWPDAARLFARYGLSCASCAISKSETIAQAAAGHGAGRVNMNELMTDLNRYADTGALPEGLP